MHLHYGTLYRRNALSGPPPPFASQWELYVRNGTRGYVSAVTAAGQAVSPVWDSNDRVMRVTNLGWTTDYVQQNSPQICLDLRNITLGSFCQGTCTYAIFDYSRTCCPFGSASL